MCNLPVDENIFAPLANPAAVCGCIFSSSSSSSAGLNMLTQYGSLLFTLTLVWSRGEGSVVRQPEQMNLQAFRSSSHRINQAFVGFPSSFRVTDLIFFFSSLFKREAGTQNLNLKNALCSLKKSYFAHFHRSRSAIFCLFPDSNRLRLAGCGSRERQNERISSFLKEMLFYHQPQLHTP